MKNNNQAFLSWRAATAFPKISCTMVLELKQISRYPRSERRDTEILCQGLIPAILLRLGDRIMLHHTAPWKERKVFIRFSDSFPRLKIDDYVTVSPLALWPSSDMGEIRGTVKYLLSWTLIPLMKKYWNYSRVPFGLVFPLTDTFFTVPWWRQNILASTLERKKKKKRHFLQTQAKHFFQLLHNKISCIQWILLCKMHLLKIYSNCFCKQCSAKFWFFYLNDKLHTPISYSLSTGQAKLTRSVCLSLYFQGRCRKWPKMS